ncbi:Nik-related protein kinase [Trichinella spiralis]|uniref:Nik-related protein kinase n=1 Tax=Trichinella spiralis TaxID=6334 RepID=A0ABR3L3S4_TRISP
MRVKCIFESVGRDAACESNSRSDSQAQQLSETGWGGTTENRIHSSSNAGWCRDIFRKSPHRVGRISVACLLACLLRALGF